MTATTYPATTATGSAPQVTSRLAIAAPILPGMADDDRAYLESVSTGARRSDHAVSRRRAGITRESAWHQQTPEGVIAVTYMEAVDVEVAMHTLATSDEAFDVFFREQVRRVHGLDLADDLPLPELLLEHGVETKTPEAVAFTVPVLPGKADAHREFMAASWHGAHREAYAASRSRAGITRELAWHQATPEGLVAIVLIETADVGAAFGSLATSTDPYDVAFRESVRDIHGIDLTDEFPLPELLLDYRA